MEQLENLCPRCGEPYYDRGGRLRCLTCGYIKPEKATKEEEILLSAAAQKLRLADFEEAKYLYEDIVENFPKNAEAHWGVLLCEYGIKYESDYDGKKIATCYSTRYESFYDNPHYKKAIDFADDKQKEYYKSQAEFIEKVRKEWIEKASKEKPYDIFLSFRDTIDGERTEDSYGAYDLYNYLTRLGYRVFFSRVTLKDKTGENYEPYIFNALNTAKVMLVYASKPDYVTSTWVKNEWTRYLSRIRAQEKRPDSLCLIIKGFNPSKLPASLKNRQLLKTEDLTYIKDLEAYLDKELKEAKITAPTIQRKEIAAKAKGAAKTIESVETIDVKSAPSAKKAHAKLEAVERRDIGNYVVPKLNATTENRITQAKYYLKAKDFARAESLYEEALEDAKENPTALMGLLLAKSSCVSLDEWISNKLEAFDDLPLVIKVINYSDIDTVTAMLDAYAAYITRLATELEWAKALELYKRFGNYDTPSINELPLTLLKDATNHIVGEGCPEFIDALLPYLKTDANAYKAALVSLGEACIREKFFEKAVIAFDTYAQYYDFNHKTFLLSLEAKKECQSVEELFHVLCKENDFSLISKDIPLPKNELEKLFVVVTDFALGELQSHPRDIVPLISFLVRCNFSFREDFIKRGINYCCDFPSDAISDAFDAFLSSFGEGEEEKLTRSMMKFAKAAMEVDVELARKYLGRVSEYDPNDEEPYRLRICIQCAVKDEDLSNGLRMGIYDYSDIESLLSLRGKRTFFDVLKPYFDAILVSPIATVVSTFDGLCGYLPKEEDSKIIPYLEKIAGECKNDGSLFVEAEKYYALLISLKPNDSSAYWGLLQSKLRCEGDDELIEQDTPLAELPEFESAKNAAGDEETLSRYIDCELKQLKRREEKEAQRKREAEEKAKRDAYLLKKARRQQRTKKIAIIAGALAAVVAVTATVVPLLTVNVIIPNTNYNNAKNLLESGNYDEAIVAFESLNDFKDSQRQIKRAQAAKSFSIGDYETGIDYARSGSLTVSVGYDSNGGSEFDRTIIYSKWITNVPTKTGYTFEKWNLRDWEMGDYSFDLTLEAEWSATKFNITYNLNGGHFDTTPVYEYTIITSAFTIPDPLRDGYTFQGWTGSLGSNPIKGITIEEGSIGDLTLTAAWSAKLNALSVISENLSKGTVSITSGSGYTDEIITVVATPAEGYYFSGWYHNSDLISSDQTYTFPMPASDYSLIARFAEENSPLLSNDGKTITYGLYPQTRVSDPSLLSSLAKLTETEPNSWYLWDGNYYAKTSASPGVEHAFFNDGSAIVSGETYWFRCEPIVWNILSYDDGTYSVLSSVLLDSHRYDDDSNNYANSEIRAWLNGGFYSTAFAFNKSHIQTMIVDNSPSTTDSSSNPYVSANTADKVYLPSYIDYLNSSYGFSTSASPTSTRYCKTTDWARANGAWHNAELQSGGWYWTRSPYSGRSDVTLLVHLDGSLSLGYNVGYRYFGVRPAITLKLS